ncbi:MAG: penicillin-binding protein, partial [Burkholderiaceae bacterium]|nr:penicillin-binding protein [Burkholderiaceae bacterium]
VVDRGTGRGIRSVYGIGADVAGKTGTSQHNADGWFILMHPQLVAGAWVGFNDPRVTMRSDYWGQGAHNALRVVGDFMQQAFAAQALDATAALPTEQGFAAALRRFGERLRRWFGFSD